MKYIKAYQRRVDTLTTALQNKYPRISMVINRYPISTEFELCLPGEEPIDILISTRMSGYTIIRTILLEPSADIQVGPLLREINDLNHCSLCARLVYQEPMGVYLEADMLFPEHLHHIFDQQVIALLDELLEERASFMDFIRSAADGEAYNPMSDLNDDWENLTDKEVEQRFQEIQEGFTAISQTLDNMIKAIDKFLEDEKEWLEDEA